MNKLILALPLLAIFGIACGSAPAVVVSPEANALGEPTGPEDSCHKITGAVYCMSSELCCPSNFSYCPPANAVYPANQVCSKREQKKSQ